MLQARHACTTAPKAGTLPWTLVSWSRSRDKTETKTLTSKAEAKAKEPKSETKIKSKAVKIYFEAASRRGPRSVTSLASGSEYRPGWCHFCAFAKGKRCCASSRTLVGVHTCHMPMSPYRWMDRLTHGQSNARPMVTFLSAKVTFS